MNWRKIFYWMLVLFTIYLIIEIVRKILGGSLTYEAMVTALLVANLGYVVGLHAKVSSINAKLSEHIGWHKGKGDK